MIVVTIILIESNQSSDEEIDGGSSDSDSEDDDSSMFIPLPTLVTKIKEKGISFFPPSIWIEWWYVLFFQGLGEQLEWIQSKLKNTADDREDNGTVF